MKGGSCRPNDQLTDGGLRWLSNCQTASRGRHSVRRLARRWFRRALLESKRSGHNPSRSFGSSGKCVPKMLKCYSMSTHDRNPALPYIAYLAGLPLLLSSLLLGNKSVLQRRKRNG